LFRQQLFNAIFGMQWKNHTQRCATLRMLNTPQRNDLYAAGRQKKGGKVQKEWRKRKEKVESGKFW